MVSGDDDNDNLCSGDGSVSRCASLALFQFAVLYSIFWLKFLFLLSLNDQFCFS